MAVEKTLSVKVNVELLEALKKQSEIEERTQKTIVNRALREYIKKSETIK